MKEKVKSLWRLCFDDSVEFIDLYFSLRYSNQVNIAIESGNEMIAALQMIPYPMTFKGKEFNTSYISGACTHPDYRNRGAMRQLLSQAFTQMLRTGVIMSTLIPAEPWLFQYYERCGYAPIFHSSKTIFHLSTEEMPQDIILESTLAYKDEQCEYLNKKLREYPSALLHTAKDYQVILADLQLSRGKVYSLTQKGSIIALAFAHPDAENGWRISEIVAESLETRELLLQQIALQEKVQTLEVSTPADSQQVHQPLGMARIINAKSILQLYASIHPEVEMNIALTDNMLSTNNGYYYLNNGKCMSSDERLPGNHQRLTIAQLTELFFADSHPHMSLMLD